MTRALLCPSCGGPLDPEARACPHCGTTAATRRCAACFDLNLVDDRNCRRCGSRLPEEDPQARRQRLSCPGCGADMTPRRVAASRFDECDHCGGLWLTPRATEAVTTEAETRARLRAFDLAPPARDAAGAPGPVAYRACPICGKLMNRSNYAAGAGVVVDVCKRHGTHFDRGELTRIFAFIEGGGLERARRREAEALREDLRDLRRKAIRVGGADVSLDACHEPMPGAGALDLLHWIARLWTSKS